MSNNFTTNTIDQYLRDGSEMSTLGAINAGANIMSSIGNLWAAHEQNKLAKETFAFNKDVFNKQWASYQEDRARKHAFENSLGDQYDRINKTGEYADSSASPSGNTLTKESTAEKQTQTPQGATRATSDAPVNTSEVNQNQQEKQYTRPKKQTVGA